MMVGIFTIDPGGSTGLAWSILNPRSRLAADAMRDRIKSGSATVTGTPVEQARAIWGFWSVFFNECVVVGRMEPQSVFLVAEDFVLRAGAVAGGKDGTAPERILYAFEGYRQGRYDTYRKRKYIAPLLLQQAGAAHRFKNQRMLKPVNAWIRGREHERSAFSHMYLAISTIMDGQGIL